MKKFSEMIAGRSVHFFITVHRPVRFPQIQFVREENVIETTAEEVLPLLPAGDTDAAKEADKDGDHGGGAEGTG